MQVNLYSSLCKLLLFFYTVMVIEKKTKFSTESTEIRHFDRCISAVKLMKFILNVCIFRGFSCPKYRLHCAASLWGGDTPCLLYTSDAADE